METEEQEEIRLKAAWYASRTADLGFLLEYNSIDEAEISRIMSEEIKHLKRMANNVTTVSDRIRRLPK